MRIAYVCADRGVPVIGCSGSSVHVRALAGALVRRGHEVTAFTACPSDGTATGSVAVPLVDVAGDSLLHEVRGQVARLLRDGGGPAIRAAETYALLLNQPLLDALRDAPGGFDVVYERQSLWSIAALQFARSAGVPFVLEVNAPLLEQQLAYRELDMAETARAIELLLFTRADLVLVTSPALADYARARGASRRRIRVLPCGVSAELFATARPPRQPGKFVVGFLGSLKPWHGVEILLDAFRQLRARSDEYRLRIVGDGPLRPVVEEFRRTGGLEDVVELVGPVAHEAVGAELARFDVGAAPYPPLPSFYFSPLKVWEYAAAGVPIVASASGELARLFPHREAALLHPPGKVGKFVKHVELLRTTPGLAVRLARRARRTARLHTWDRLAARWESLVRTIGAGSRAACGPD